MYVSTLFPNIQSNVEIGKIIFSWHVAWTKFKNSPRICCNKNNRPAPENEVKLSTHSETSEYYKAQTSHSEILQMTTTNLRRPKFLIINWFIFILPCPLLALVIALKETRVLIFGLLSILWRSLAYMIRFSSCVLRKIAFWVSLYIIQCPRGGCTCLIFVRGCANAVYETIPFLLTIPLFFEKDTLSIAIFW